MSTYRKMRRQARLARRGGLQPMIVISSGESFPETVAVVLARCAWRYRSELAPVAVALATFAAALWLHASRPQWGAFIVALACGTASVTLFFGSRIGLTNTAECAYAAAAILATGTWLGEAAWSGPFRTPLPHLLITGTLILAVPWWAHRRRRAKVRVDRKLQAWPDIAKAIGLAGSEMMSAVVDVWGWRARLRLARGQTIADVTTRIPAIESGLGTFRGAVRVYPTSDELANRCEIRVLDIDPHAGAIPWRGPSVNTITRPIDLGPFEDATPCAVSFLRKHALGGGTTGAGKSGWLNVLMGNFAACRDVVVWAIDLKKGMELQPWQPCIGRLATTPQQALALLQDAVAIQETRAAWLASHGRRAWEPSPDMPALIVIIDEYAELKDEAPDAMRYTDSIARLGRAVAVTLIAATQRPTQKAMGEGAVRSQMDIRICFRVRERKDTDLILGQGMLTAGWDAQTLNAPGKFLISDPGHDAPKRARAYLLTDEIVRYTAARLASSRPRLDAISRNALEARQPIHPDAAPPSPDPSHNAPRDALWLALQQASNEGTGIGELMRITGWKRTKLYRHLQMHAHDGRALQVSRGHWR